MAECNQIRQNFTGLRRMNFEEISLCFFSGKFVKGLTKASVQNAMQRRKSLDGMLSKDTQDSKEE